jgi:hypothetical protein
MATYLLMLKGSFWRSKSAAAGDRKPTRLWPESV